MLEKNKVIKHKNILSYAKYENFELRELKLLLKLIMEYQVSKEKDMVFSAQEIKKFINMDKKSYKEFAVIVRELGKKEILIKENDEISIYHIFSKLVLNLEKKEIKLVYTPDFLELIGNMNEKYCQYNLKNIENLQSKYGILFYMRSRAELFKGKFSLTIEMLKNLYGENYRTDNIDRYILSPAITEINKYTDLNIFVEKNYKSQNKGRSKLISYTFKVTKKINKISEELKKTITKAKKNIYISKSKTLNEESIQILLEELSQEDLIKGLNFAYDKINRDFSKLEYLKKVILSGIFQLKENNELIEIFNIKTDEEKTTSIIKYEEITLSPNNNEFNEFLEKEEHEIIDYLVKDGMSRQFLLKIKQKNKIIYENILKSVIHKIKKESI